MDTSIVGGETQVCQGHDSSHCNVCVPNRPEEPCLRSYLFFAWSLKGVKVNGLDTNVFTQDFKSEMK